jgi:hypothetical protein
MLKSHTEEIDCEREIETREPSIIIFGSSNFSRAEPLCRAFKFPVPLFSCVSPDLTVRMRRVSIYLLGRQHFFAGIGLQR